MFDVLVYLFENYYQAENYPDHETLTRKLHAAGFENDDISEALDWLKGLAKTEGENLPESLDESDSFRSFASDELSRITPDGRGFLIFLESARILTPLFREVIIERAMALPDDQVGLDKLKVIVLMVIWTRRGSVDSLVLDELLPDGEKRQMH